MNVTYLKQGELLLKSHLKKILSSTYRVYAGVKESILPDFLKRHVLNIEHFFNILLKKKQ